MAMHRGLGLNADQNFVCKECYLSGCTLVIACILWWDLILVYMIRLRFRIKIHTLRAGTHGEISFDSVDSRSSSVYVNVNYSHEHTVNS